jgi:hypothetical protein
MEAVRSAIALRTIEDVVPTGHGFSEYGIGVIDVASCISYPERTVGFRSRNTDGSRDSRMENSSKSDLDILISHRNEP